jgi:hypothetical protein
LFAAAEPLPAEKRVAVIQPCKRRRATPKRGLRRKSDGCDTAKQKKKSHAGGEACGERESHARGEAYGEGKGNLRGDKVGREKERNGEDGKGLYCWDAP